MNADLEMFCHRLLGALLNGAYQGLLLTAVIWLGLKFYPRANAATRHMVWLITLLFVAVLPAVHFLLPEDGKQETGLKEDSEAGWRLAHSNNIEHGLGASKTTGEPLAARRPGSIGPTHQNTFNPNQDSPSREAGYSTLGSESLRSGTLADLLLSAEREAALEATNATKPVAETSASSKIDLSQALRLARFWRPIPENWRLSLPNGAGAAFVGLWIVLAIFRLGNLARQSRRLCFLKRHAAMAPDGLRAVFQALSAEMGIRRNMHLLTCPESAAPMAVGFRRPAVLLPATMFEGVQAPQLEQVLRHELAHFSRGDDWTNLIQQTIKAVLFFHPAVWWLSKRLTVEREIACDDHVLAATRTPRSYALFLTEFASRRHDNDLAAAPAAWSNKHQLTERINMILDSNRNASPRLARARVGVLTTAAALTALFVLNAGPRLVFAADERTDTDRAEAAINNDKEIEIDLDTSVVAEISTEVTIDSEAPPLPPLLTVTDALTPPAAPIESGPRAKRNPKLAPVTDEVSSPAATPRRMPVAVHPPAAAQGANVAVRPVARVAVAPPNVYMAQAAAAPQPVPPKSRRPGDDSIERRLERLERMVEELLAREKGKKQIGAEHDFHFNLKGPAIDFPKDKFDKLIDKEKFAKLAEEQKKFAEKFQKFGPNEEELARIKEQAGRAAERAAREVEKAARDSERAANENKNRANVDDNRAQRQELEARRRSLEKQMQALQRQIERLAEEQEHADLKRVDHERKLKQSDKDSDSSKPTKTEGEDKPKR